MCGETRVRVGFGPLPQGPRNSPPPLPPYIQPLGRRLDFGFCLDQKFAIAATSLTSFVFNDQTKASRNDEDINTIVTPTAPTITYDGPITRARARQLNYQVLSLLGNDCNVHENMMLPKLDTFVLLTNEGPSLEKDDHWSKNKHGVDGMRKGDNNRVSSDDFRTLKPP